MKPSGVFASIALASFAFVAAAQAADPAPPPGWIVAKNHACKIWNPEPHANESVTWSGACKNGFASGKGVLIWTENGKRDSEFDGEYANGKRNGPGVLITPDGKRIAGTWADDEPLTAGGDSI
jgi:hypothetical protein